VTAQQHSNMREIPSLRVLCLRAVGPPTCSPEAAFGGPRVAALLKRSKSGIADDSDSDNEDSNSNAIEKDKTADSDVDKIIPPEEPTLTSVLLKKLRNKESPMQAYKGLARPNANDVDIAHPWIMTVHPPREDGNNEPLITPTEGADNMDIDNDDTAYEFLAIENSNHAVETIQQFIDALVESGRANDTRMGLHFFREWVYAITGKEPKAIVPKKKINKKRKISISAKTTAIDESLPLGSLSLHNFAAGSIHTFRSMEKANVGSCLGTLDISGVHGLTDSILTNIICGGSFPRIKRLSVKNCRKLTGKGIASLVKLTRLTALDVGGCYNVLPNDVVSLVERHPSTKKGVFTEIYAGGLGWTDVALEELVDATVGYLRGLGVGFSPYITGAGLSLTLSKLSSTLDRLAVPFCPGMDDAAVSSLGSTLPKLAVLDIRGTNVSSLSGLLEARAGIVSTGHLFVLARYSGISKKSLDETKKRYEGTVAFDCILDGKGNGGGIRR